MSRHSRFLDHNILMLNNSINILEDFLFKSKECNLIINIVNDEIGCFYETIIKKICLDKIKVINSFDNIKPNEENDLFGLERIFIYNLTNIKKIEEVINSKNKKIILTDYKSYKRLEENNLVINGYNFEKDLKKFLNKYLQIDDEKLINQCILKPSLTFSEISKFLINKQSDTSGYFLEGQNFILEIRKDIFNYKKNRLDIRKLYLKLKEEVKYKRFNF